MATENDVFGKRLVGNKKRIGKGKVLGLSLLALVAAGAGYLGLTPHGRETVKLVSGGIKTIVAAKQNPDLIFDKTGSDHVNILLIGRDVNWKPARVYDPRTKTYRPFRIHDPNSSARADSMIVVSLDKTKNTIRLVSLPRDAKVRIAHNDIQNGLNKLNAAHAYGGPALLMKTIHDELGITIHHYAVIKFEGFKKLIDEVGGVTVNVDGALKRKNGKLYRGNLDYDDNWGMLHIHLKPGVQRLDGQTAHDYVRFREDIEGDPGRIRRQQQVMRALAKAVMHAGPFKIPGLVKEVRRQFDTSLSDEEIASAAFFANRLGDANKIQPLTMFGVYSSRGSLTLNGPKNAKLLAAVFGSTFDRHHFLKHSPTTDGDEVGVTNDSNPGARQVLREAGLLKDASSKTNPELAAPVEHEDTSRLIPRQFRHRDPHAETTSGNAASDASQSDAAPSESSSRADTAFRDNDSSHRDSSSDSAHASSDGDEARPRHRSRHARRDADGERAAHHLSVESSDSSSVSRSSSSDDAPVRSQR